MHKPKAWSGEKTTNCAESGARSQCWRMRVSLEGPCESELKLAGGDSLKNTKLGTTVAILFGKIILAASGLDGARSGQMLW